MANIIKRIVGAGIATITSFFKAMQDKISLLLPTGEEIEIIGSKYAEEKRLPTFEEAVEVHSPTLPEKIAIPFKKVYDKLLIPAQKIGEFARIPSPIDPDAAFAISAGLIPIAAGVTIGAGVLDGALEAASGTKAVACGLGKVEALRAVEGKLWTRMGLAAATGIALASPTRIGLLRNLDYFYNSKFLSQKLTPSDSYDAVRFREFLTEDEWGKFEPRVELKKPIEEMTPEEIKEWADTAGGAVDEVEGINAPRFVEAMTWHGYKPEDIATLDRAAKRAPRAMMLRQMAMRGFFDPLFFARSVFKGGYDNWAIKPMLNFFAYMAQEGMWVGYREAAQGAFVRGLLTEDELRAVLKRIHVPKMLLEPIIATQKLRKETEDKELTLSPLKTAYKKGVLTEEEFRTKLKELGYSEDAITILIETEKVMVAPKIKRPTVAQMSRAFREQIINEADLKAYLESVGYKEPDITLLVDLEKAKYPVTKPELTMSKLTRAYQEGVITLVVLQQKLKAMGYSKEAQAIIIELANTTIRVPTASLSKAETMKAWKTEIIDTHETTTRLFQMGYGMEDIEILFKIHKP